MASRFSCLNLLGDTGKDAFQMQATPFAGSRTQTHTPRNRVSESLIRRLYRGRFLLRVYCFHVDKERNNLATKS